MTKKILFLLCLSFFLFAKVKISVTLSLPNHDPLKNREKEIKNLLEKWSKTISNILITKDYKVNKEFSLSFKKGYSKKDDLHIIKSLKKTSVFITKNYLKKNNYGELIEVLTDLIQGYKKGSPSWVKRGITAYIRYAVFEGLPITHFRRTLGKSYKDKDSQIAGGFLFYLELGPLPGAIRILNKALRKGNYSTKIFKKHSKVSLNILWERYHATLARFSKKYQEATPLPTVKINLNYSQAPNLEKWLKRIKNLLSNWYSRVINVLTYHNFKRKSSFSLYILKKSPHIAYAYGNKIFFKKQYVEGNSGDIGMTIHEMVHLIQNSGKPGWVIEGIADYIRNVIFEGRPLSSFPYSSGKEDYKKAYRFSAGFFFWLESDLAPGIVRILNRSKYSDTIFHKQTGYSLNKLWEMYVKERRKK